MTVREARRVLPFSQLLLILMGILVLYLAADFVRQMAVGHQRKEDLLQLDEEILVAGQETVELEKEYAQVGSPAAIEAAVRPQGLAREDEVVVILVGAPTDTLPEKEQEPRMEGGFDSPREAWWDLFFGTR